MLLLVMAMLHFTAAPGLSLQVYAWLTGVKP